jgi:tRNA (Thr-GGU) A37 N-methylase
MITLQAIGVVQCSRTGVADDFGRGVLAAIELARELPEESLDGLGEFSHAEILDAFDRVADTETASSFPGNPRVGQSA